MEQDEIDRFGRMIREGAQQQGRESRNGEALPGDEIAPTAYRKLPVQIKAIRWSGTNLRAVIDFIGRHESANAWTWEHFEEVVRTKGLKIFTLEGHHMATVGDYIIKGVHGEAYPCKPDIFWKTYERADAPRSERAAHWRDASKLHPRLQDPVLLNCSGGVLGDLISTGFLRENGGGVPIWAIDMDHPSDGARWVVTHWMPLPNPPGERKD